MDSEKQEIEINRIPKISINLCKVEIIYRNFRGDISLTSGYVEDAYSFLRVTKNLTKWGYEIIAYSFGEH